MPNLWPPCGVAGRQGGPSRAVAVHSELDDGRHVLPSVIIDCHRLPFKPSWFGGISMDIQPRERHVMFPLQSNGSFSTEPWCYWKKGIHIYIYTWKEGFTHFETTNHSHDSTIHIELIDALHTQCFAVQLRFEPPKKLLFGRFKMRNRNTLLHFLRIMYATYTVYIPTLSGNPFLINQRGFYWRNSAFRQSELRSMGPAPEVWDFALLNFCGGSFSQRFLWWNNFWEFAWKNFWGNNSKQFHIKFLQTWKPETLPVFNKKMIFQSWLKALSSMVRVARKPQRQAQRFQLVPKLMPKFHSSWCHLRDEWSMLSDWCLAVVSMKCKDRR